MRPEQLASLVQYLQGRLDDERANLADELHDTLGGLLIAAKMDLSQMENSLGSERAELRARLAQVREKLDAAIATKRGMVEQLRPGVLVHIGLFAALRWFVEDLCIRTGNMYRLRVPDEEVPLPLAERVALYRVAQEALILGGPDSKHPTDLTADLHANSLRLQVTRRGGRVVSAEDELRVLGMLSRLGAMNGGLTITRDAGLLRVAVRVPLRADGADTVST